MRRVSWPRGITVAASLVAIALAVGTVLGWLLEPVVDVITMSITLAIVGAAIGHFGMRLTKPWWFPPAAPPAPVKQWTEDQL